MKPVTHRSEGWKKTRVPLATSALCGALCVAASGCLTNAPTSSPITSPSATPTSAIAIPDGPKAVKIILKESTVGGAGSFDSAPATGTAPKPGFGHYAARVFSADGQTLLTTWPRWLKFFEIGVSGTANSKATNPNCARFTTTAEAAATTCNFSADPVREGTFACAGPDGYYRVSELDCLQDTIGDGTGMKDDGVYLRAYFSREAADLGPSENIMAVVEYSASALNAPVSAPTNCVDPATGRLTPEACYDFVWKAFLRPSFPTGADTAYQPFLLFIPPVTGFVNTTKETGGGGITSKQLILPLASDPNLKVFELVRTKSTLNKDSDAFKQACSRVAGGTREANSPGCAGVVFYSVTFYRI